MGAFLLLIKECFTKIFQYDKIPVMVRIVPLGCQNPLSMVSAVYSADRLLQSIFGWRVAECINTSHYFLCLIVLNLQPPKIYGGFLLRHVTKEM